MRLMAVALSLSPLLIAEWVLRIQRSRGQTANALRAIDSDPLVDLHQLKPLFVPNQRGDQWEIPSDRFNFFCKDSFAAKKPANCRRIFVLGGSTTQGRPFATDTAFSSWLRLRLEAGDPETKFEVVNCGGVSYASYRVVRILEEVLAHQPDAIVIYCGHNEFLEDREYASVRKITGWNQTLISALQKIEIARWIKKNSLPEAPLATVMPQEVSTRLDRYEGLKKYRRDPQWRENVEQHYLHSLERMLLLANQANVPLIVCVPEGDLVNTPPFKVTPDASLGAEALRRFETGWTVAQDPNEQISKRLDATVQCLQLDPLHAGANYVHGRLQYDRGNHVDALNHLTLARDEDVCPLRATSPIMKTVKQLAEQGDAIIVDVPALFDQRDHNGSLVPDGIPDPEWFVDHVHPTINGHQVIAEACFDAMKFLPWVKETEDSNKTYETSISNHLGRLGEEYFARGKQRLEGLRTWSAGRSGEPPDPSTQ